MMQEIMAMRQRLETGDRDSSAVSLSWHAFELMRTACRSCESHDSPVFAAYSLAAASAVKARNILAAAPSMQPVCRAAAFEAADVADLVAASAELAGLATALAAFLPAAAKGQRDPGDADALRRAAQEAANIRELLTPSP